MKTLSVLALVLFVAACTQPAAVPDEPAPAETPPAVDDAPDLEEDLPTLEEEDLDLGDLDGLEAELAEI